MQNEIRIPVRLGSNDRILTRDDRAFYLCNESRREESALTRIEEIPFSEICSVAFEPFVYETKRDVTYGNITLTLASGTVHKLTLRKFLDDDDFLRFFTPVSDKIVHDEKQESRRREEKQVRTEYIEWLREHRNPSVFRALYACNLFMFIAPFCFILLGISNSSLALKLSLIVFGINFALMMLFPACFTTIGEKSKSYKELYRMDSISAIIWLMTPTIGNCLLMLRNASNAKGIFLPSLLITAALMLLLFLRYRHETKLRSVMTCVAAAFLLAVVMLGTFSAASYHFRSETPISTKDAVITELDVHKSRRSTSYDATLALEDGSVVSYDITSSFYRNSKEGDTVRIATYEGWLGSTFTVLEKAE